ncbi:tetratricopeptide repeat protein [Streptomyces sp. NBC_00728]|uniref:tetratricopeptide repeat protein n=1 Tax=Streptomyces sp. NBC_00728 TaxID=2903676 RepID=UPI00386369D5
MSYGEGRGVEQLLRARELAEARKFRESRELIDRAEPSGAEELSLAASVLVRLRDPEAALRLAERAVRLAPEDWRGWVTISDAELMRGRYDSAVAAGRTAVRLAPDEPQPHRALGGALVKIFGRGPEARGELRRARELGGRKALRKPAPPAPWVFVAFAVFLVSSAVTLVGDWPPEVEHTCVILRPLSMAALFLALRGPSRAGLDWRRRAAEMRAAHEELYGSGGPEAIRRAEMVLTPWGAATGVCGMLLAAPGFSGHPLPQWAAVLAAPVLGCLLLLGAGRWVHWWYGERFLREVLLPNPLVKVDCAAAGALLGGAVLLALGDAAEPQWRVLFAGALAWFVLALLVIPLVATVRADARTRREKAVRKTADPARAKAAPRPGGDAGGGAGGAGGGGAGGEAVDG